jgi:hypothetical protein
MMMVGLCTAAPASAQDGTRIAYQLYESMMGRFARGTPEETVSTLRVLTETASDIAEVHYLYAIAFSLSGRGDATAARNAALAALSTQPQNPLFQMAALLTEPKTSVRGPDGIVVLTDSGVARLRQILVLMSTSSSTNARVLSRELGRIEAAGADVGGGRAIAFGYLSKQAGLFTVRVDEIRFRAAEGAILARIDGGPQRVSGEDRAYRELEKRADVMIAELYGASPDRVRMLADNLKATLAEMGKVVSRIRGVVDDLAAIFGPLRRGGEQIATLDADIQALEQRRLRREEQVNAVEQRTRRVPGAR